MWNRVKNRIEQQADKSSIKVRFAFLIDDLWFQVQSEIRLPKTQGIAGHVATTGVYWCACSNNNNNNE